MNCIDKIINAIDFIESNLKQNININDIAYNAYYSPFHFCRIFIAFAGESPGSYLRKRRLTEAANEIISTNKRIIDIAVDFQFNSQEAFTRSFKNLFGITPGEYRRNSKSISIYSFSILDKKKLLNLTGELLMEPKFIKKDEFYLIGMPCYEKLTGNPANSQAAKMWDLFEKKQNKIKNVKKFNSGYGLCYYPDETCENNKWYYMPAIEVDNLSQIPMEMVGKIIPAQEYAVFTHKGKIYDLQKTYDYIFKTWFTKSDKYEIAERFDFEYYDERFKGRDDKDSELDIYIPIKEK